MDALILYGLVLLFLLAFPLFIFFFVQKPSVQAKHKNTHSAQGDGVSYGLVLAVFVFFSVLTFLVHRNK